MSTTKATVIWCDNTECTENLNAMTGSVKRAQAKAHVYHWTSRKGTHLCPLCSQVWDIDVQGEIVLKEQAV